MSVSTDAILFYGYHWDEGEIGDEEEKKKLPVQWGDSVETAVWRQVLEARGLDSDDHCCEGCLLPYLFVEESRIRAARGYPKAIDPTKCIPHPEWDLNLDAALRDLGISKPTGQDAPRWWLVSWWG